MFARIWWGNDPKGCKEKHSRGLSVHGHFTCKDLVQNIIFSSRYSYVLAEAISKKETFESVKESRAWSRNRIMGVLEEFHMEHGGVDCWGSLLWWTLVLGEFPVLEVKCAKPIAWGDHCWVNKWHVALKIKCKLNYQNNTEPELVIWFGSFFFFSEQMLASNIEDSG